MQWKKLHEATASSRRKAEQLVAEKLVKKLENI